MLPKSNPTDLLKKAINIASCYGFDSIDKVAVQKKHFDNLNKEKEANAPQSKKTLEKTGKQKMRDLKRPQLDIFCARPSLPSPSCFSISNR